MLCAAWLCSLCSACWLEARRGARAMAARGGFGMSALALVLALVLALALVSVLGIGSRTASRLAPGMGSGIASRTTRTAPRRVGRYSQR